MREIINIQVGECGNQIGSSFWDTLCNEHKLSKTGKLTGDEEKDDSQLSKIGVYFKQLDIENKKESKYVPRCVLVDLDSSSLDAIKSSSSGALFNPDDFIAGKSSATNNWAKGYYTFGSQLIDQIMDSIRKQVECCDCAQGFQMIHSLGGGTGSGLGSLILLKIRDHYPDRISATFSVFPSSKVSHVITETYNAILTLNELLELSDQTFIIHNQSLYDISKNILKQEKPKYAELNWIASQAMSGITASLRFDHDRKLNCDLRKMGINLVAFPNLHFIAVSHAPLFGKQQDQDPIKRVKCTPHQITDQMWVLRDLKKNCQNILAPINTDDGKYLSGSCIYRGDKHNVSNQAIDAEMYRMTNIFSDYCFTEWIPNNIKSSVINVSPPNETPITGTFMFNHTQIRYVFQLIKYKFSKIFNEKVQLFSHLYLGEGMNDSELKEADRNVCDLIVEYQDKEDNADPHDCDGDGCQKCCPETDDEEDDEDDE